MVNKILFFISLCIAFGCNQNPKIPNVGNIKVDAGFKRFDNDFFSIDTNQIKKGTDILTAKYPEISDVFFAHILGISDSNFNEGTKYFYRVNRPLYDSSKRIFSNIDFLSNQFSHGFKLVKYYFPNYNLPQLVAMFGPFDAFAQTASGSMSPNFMGPGFMVINLQFYQGTNFSMYHESFYIDNVAPLFRSRRFSKEYIISDAMQLITDDLFPDKSSGKPLITQMVEKGKQWWLLDKFLPTTPDSIKSGYTEKQLNWCKKYEGLIWSTILKNEDLYAINPTTIQNYIGEAPFTQGFPQESSPGNLGQWIGWQIVKKFAANSHNLSVEDIMKTDATVILDKAQYKPK